MDHRALSGPETEDKSLPELQAMYVAILASLPADVYPLVQLIPETGQGFGEPNRPTANGPSLRRLASQLGPAGTDHAGNEGGSV